MLTQHSQAFTEKENQVISIMSTKTVPGFRAKQIWSGSRNWCCHQRGRRFGFRQERMVISRLLGWMLRAESNTVTIMIGLRDAQTINILGCLNSEKALPNARKQIAKDLKRKILTSGRCWQFAFR
jgi:hypothetical protein